MRIQECVCICIYKFRLLCCVCKTKPQLHILAWGARNKYTNNTKQQFWLQLREAETAGGSLFAVGLFSLSIRRSVVFTLDGCIYTCSTLNPRLSELPPICKRPMLVLTQMDMYAHIIKSAGDCVTRPTEHLSLHNPNAIHSLRFVF